MSITPLPNHKFTKTTVLDREFRIKYNLTTTQTEIIAYLVMISQSWKNLIRVDGYFVILTSKLEQDLLLGQKTIEAAITKFKKLGLIETKLVKVEQWNSNENFRGVKLTDKSLNYSLSHYKPAVHQEIVDLKKENENIRVKNDELLIKDMKLEEELKEYKAYRQAIQMQDDINESLDETVRNNLYLLAEQKEEIELLKYQLKKTKDELNLKIEEIEDIKKSSNVSPKKKDEDLEKFIKKIINQYSKTGLPICNSVTNEDNWLREVVFTINSYHKLSFTIEDGTEKQIVSSKKIVNFWRWLYANQHRVGVILDTKNPPNISHLDNFIDQSVILNEKICLIHKIKAVIGGVQIILVNNDTGQLIQLYNGLGNKVSDLTTIENWLKKNAFSTRVLDDL